MLTIAIDLAEKAGFAWYDSDSDIYYVAEIKGDAERQFHYVEQLIGSETDVTLLVEDFVYFNGFPKAQASLLKRLGVLEYLLSKINYKMIFLNVSSVRVKYFKGGTKKKKRCLDYFVDTYGLKFTDNHTDAILMLLYHLDIKEIDKLDIRIVK